MPELPEVETTRRGVEPLVKGRRILSVLVRNPSLRWPVALPADLDGQRIEAVDRRAKYLLFRLETGTIIVHLGMSGSLRVLSGNTAPLKHDHVEWVLDDGRVLRLNDPRRFGSVHWQERGAPTHWLLADLGVEPLSVDFSGGYLKKRARGRRSAIKSFLMDGRIVVGVGNIYANEALFLAGIRPRVAAGRVSLAGYDGLARAVRQVLGNAITMGGTTLRDFVDQDGNPGYFKQSLYVYGRESQPCKVCAATLKGFRLGQRATVYCPNCQRAQSFKPPKC